MELTEFHYSSAGSYLFISHTGFGGVAYGMAIICCRLDAQAKLNPQVAVQPKVDIPLYSVPEENTPSVVSDDPHRMDDYRDILSLTRVLMNGPQSKSDVDCIIERYAPLFPFLKILEIICVCIFSDHSLFQE